MKPSRLGTYPKNIFPFPRTTPLKMQLARKRYFCIFLNSNSKFFPACFEYFALTLFYWQIPGMMIMVIGDNCDDDSDWWWWWWWWYVDNIVAAKCAKMMRLLALTQISCIRETHFGSLMITTMMRMVIKIVDDYWLQCWKEKMFQDLLWLLSQY